LALFSRVLTVAAREWDIVVTNPLDKVSRPQQRNERSRTLSLFEQARLLDQLEPRERDPNGQLMPGGTLCIWAKAIVVVAIETAMRRSELLS
jgi:integrase